MVSGDVGNSWNSLRNLTFIEEPIRVGSTDTATPNCSHKFQIHRHRSACTSVAGCGASYCETSCFSRQALPTSSFHFCVFWLWDASLVILTFTTRVFMLCHDSQSNHNCLTIRVPKQTLMRVGGWWGRGKCILNLWTERPHWWCFPSKVWRLQTYNKILMNIRLSHSLERCLTILTAPGAQIIAVIPAGWHACLSQNRLIIQFV